MHRKIYRKHYGPIPRGYHVHHIDGNHLNNDPSNLKAVTIQEHFDIHYKQGDYGACARLQKQIMNNDYEGVSNFLSELVTKTNTRRMNDGTHNFLGENNPGKKMKGKQMTKTLKKLAGLMSWV